MIGKENSLYIGGHTASADFPTPNGWDTSFGGGASPYDTDGFLVKLKLDGGITVSPLSHDFKEIQLYSCSFPLEITMSNTGNADLSISDIVLSDTENFSIDLSGGLNPLGNKTSTIAPGSNKTLMVTFSPTSIGEKSATLIIDSNDVVNPSVSVSLAGEGVNVGISGRITFDQGRDCRHNDPNDMIVPQGTKVELHDLDRSSHTKIDEAETNAYGGFSFENRYSDLSNLEIRVYASNPIAQVNWYSVNLAYYYTFKYPYFISFKIRSGGWYQIIGNELSGAFSLLNFINTLDSTLANKTSDKPIWAGENYKTWVQKRGTNKLQIYWPLDPFKLDSKSEESNIWYTGYLQKPNDNQALSFLYKGSIPSDKDDVLLWRHRKDVAHEYAHYVHSMLGNEWKGISILYIFGHLNLHTKIFREGWAEFCSDMLNYFLGGPIVEDELDRNRAYDVINAKDREDNAKRGIGVYDIFRDMVDHPCAVPGFLCEEQVDFINGYAMDRASYDFLYIWNVMSSHEIPTLYVHDSRNKDFWSAWQECNYGPEANQKLIDIFSLHGVNIGTASVNPGGTTARFSGMTLTIGSASISEETTISLSAINQSSENMVSASYSLTPINETGSLSFSIPAKLEISYDDTNLSLQQEESLSIYCYNESNGKWEPLPSVVDIEDNQTSSNT